jgi:hypothetical protein
MFDPAGEAYCPYCGHITKEMLNRVKLISVDLDHSSIVQLLRIYFSAPHAISQVCHIDDTEASQVPIEITVSSSGVGYHIKLFKQVTVLEDLKIRALLWDHADRLVYALKKWALNPQEAYVDLVFDEKNKGKERILPLEDILNCYKKKVKEIMTLLDKGENEKADNKVRELAKKIEPSIKEYKGKSYVGIIAFNDDHLREQLETVCTDIADVDTTFTWKMYPSWVPEYEWFLALFGTDKDQLWKRLVWLKNNAKDKDGKLLLKDVDTRMWTKERKAT